MFRYPKIYDVIVIGAGHAGVEAAMAAARLGAQVAVLTQNLDTIGQMSCNPAIGGLAKGHMVREIDALGGVMGLNTDATGIQWRMLNASKGPSVRAPRAQCDKKAYQFRMKRELEAMPRTEACQHNVIAVGMAPEQNMLVGRVRICAHRAVQQRSVGVYDSAQAHDARRIGTRGRRKGGATVRYSATRIMQGAAGRGHRMC